MNDIVGPSDPGIGIPSSAVALQPNIVAKIFERYGGLDPMVARRVRLAPKIRDMRRLGDNFTERDRADALSRLDRIPPLPDLQRDVENLEAAAFGRAEEPEARLIIGIILESIPAAGSQVSATYIDALVFQIQRSDDDRGFSCHVMASAAHKIWAKFRFAPAIAELLPILRDTRAEYCCALAQTRRLIELREDAEQWIAIDNNPWDMDDDD
jgi:hypothetical protein